MATKDRERGCEREKRNELRISSFFFEEKKKNEAPAVAALLTQASKSVGWGGEKARGLVWLIDRVWRKQRAEAKEAGEKKKKTGRIKRWRLYRNSKNEPCGTEKHFKLKMRVLRVLSHRHSSSVCFFFFLCLYPERSRHSRWCRSGAGSRGWSPSFWGGNERRRSGEGRG